MREYKKGKDMIKLSLIFPKSISNFEISWPAHGFKPVAEKVMMNAMEILNQKNEQVNVDINVNRENDVFSINTDENGAQACTHDKPKIIKMTIPETQECKGCKLTSCDNCSASLPSAFILAAKAFANSK